MTPWWLGSGGQICGVRRPVPSPPSGRGVVFKSLSSETSDRCIVLVGEWRVFLGGGPELSCVFGVLLLQVLVNFVSLGPRPQPSRLLVCLGQNVSQNVSLADASCS